MLAFCSVQARVLTHDAGGFEQQVDGVRGQGCDRRQKEPANKQQQQQRNKQKHVTTNRKLGYFVWSCWLHSDVNCCCSSTRNGNGNVCWGGLWCVWQTTPHTHTHVYPTGFAFLAYWNFMGGWQSYLRESWLPVVTPPPRPLPHRKTNESLLGLHVSSPFQSWAVKTV